MVCVRALQYISASWKLTVTNPQQALSIALGRVATNLSATSRPGTGDDQCLVERDGISPLRHRTVTVANKSRFGRPGVDGESGRSGLRTDLCGDLPADQSSRSRSYESAYAPSDTHVYNQQKEVS
jgi:hypothetical protein